MDVKEWLVAATDRPGTVIAHGFVQEQGVLKRGVVSLKAAINAEHLTLAQQAQMALDTIRGQIQKAHPSYAPHLPASLHDGAIEVWAKPAVFTGPVPSISVEDGDEDPDETDGIPADL